MNVVFRFEASPDVEMLGDDGDSPKDSPSEPGEIAEDGRVRRALLVGQPNVGKSVVFGALTGTYVTVSNYPGTTVEIARGRAHIGLFAWEVVDTPGTHNLVPMSEDEAVARDILLSESIDALVQVGDCKNLARTLLLSLQLAELGIPFCLDLNMADEARARGLHIDVAALERELPGIRVARTTATDGEGLDQIRADLQRACVEREAPDQVERFPLPCAPRFPDDIEDAIRAVEEALGPARVAKRALATMLLAATPDAQLAVPAVADDARRIARDRAGGLERSRGAPAFAVFNRLRIERARTIVRAVQSHEAPQALSSASGAVSWSRSALVGILAGLLGVLAVDAALFKDGNLFAVLCLGVFVAGLDTVLVRRHLHASAGAWKILGAYVAGWLAFESASLVARVLGRAGSPVSGVVGVATGLVALALAARVGDSSDARLSRGFGRIATHPIWGVPILCVMLLLAYKIVGVFGAGTAVDFVENAVFGRYINPAASALFARIGIPLLTAFVVGPYGMLTMGITYAVAIVLPVVATFFFVFSILEDSGYLPRLAVMTNRILRTMGLNGKAVLPMVLGLGCDTMATLTARIMSTRKERALVTLLLALGIPCSSQLSVIFALMQRTSRSATLVWIAVVLLTLFGVGWIAARVLPGDRSDFLLEMPPIRRPVVSNILAKTLARIEWYLREAVPLFLAGTALLFLLDTFRLLGAVHRLGEPVVHGLLGFSRDGGVADRVSEALVVGFLRRDFGAAGLLDMARAGLLTSADIAVSMVTITLFIPCIANLFMIGKERGWKVAAAMSAFIFPYAVAVGAVVRLGFRFFGAS